MYVVKYSKGDYDDYREIIVFVTDRKTTATKYVTKFNKMLKKWREYYSQFEDNKRFPFTWFRDDAPTLYYDRWYMLREIYRCWWEEIEVR